MMTSVLLKALPTEIPEDTRCRPWKSPEILDLLRRRKTARKEDRRNISIQIHRKIRQIWRRFLAEETEKILKEFQNLDRLHGIHRLPVRKVHHDYCSPAAFSEFLKEIYEIG